MHAHLFKVNLEANVGRKKKSYWNVKLCNKKLSQNMFSSSLMDL